MMHSHTPCGYKRRIVHNRRRMDAEYFKEAHASLSQLNNPVNPCHGMGHPHRHSQHPRTKNPCLPQKNPPMKASTKRGLLLDSLSEDAPHLLISHAVAEEHSPRTTRVVTLNRTHGYACSIGGAAACQYFSWRVHLSHLLSLATPQYAHRPAPCSCDCHEQQPEEGVLKACIYSAAVFLQRRLFGFATSRICVDNAMPLNPWKQQGHKKAYHHAPQTVL